MLKVLLDDANGLAAGLLRASGADAKACLAQVTGALARLPKVEGSGADQVYIAPEMSNVLKCADEIATKAGDSYVTVARMLLGLALASVINARGSRWRAAALIAFGLQLIVNLIWSPVFFGMHRLHIALALIVAMFVLTAATIWLFAKVRSGAALLMVPYLLWILFAGYLNFAIIQLNPGADGHLAPGGAATQITL